MESTKVKYQLYYYIPWPECQKLWEDDSIHKFISLTEDGEVFVDKLWFDKNRDNYGL